MTSADTNLFVYAFNAASPFNAAARSFFDGIISQKIPFAICELVLIELYMSLRNPVVNPRGFTASQAVDYCEQLRNNPAWQWIDYNPGIREELWSRNRRDDLAFRAAIDSRLALTLRHYGVTHFATANVKHFTDFGFTRVWNPVQPTS